MPMISTLSDDVALAGAGALFRGLAEPARLRILRELTGGERRVVDLTELLGLAQGTVSGHLACLRDCGLVVARPEGRQMFYSLAQPELLDLFAAAERFLAVTGTSITLCPIYGCAGDSVDDRLSDPEVGTRA